MSPTPTKINDQSPMATRISILSFPDDSFLQPVFWNHRTWRSSNRQPPKLSNANTSRMVPRILSHAPKMYKPHQTIPKKAAASAAKRRYSSPLKNIQYRRRPFSGLISSSKVSALSVSSSFNGLLQSLTLGVVNFEFAKERGLRADLRAVADNDDLHVRGVQIFARRGEHVLRS